MAGLLRQMAPDSNRVNSKVAAKQPRCNSFPFSETFANEQSTHYLLKDRSNENVREFHTSPHSRSASIARQHPGATGDAFLPPKCS